MKLISRLQYITTSAALAEQACKGGVDWIQLRLKNVSYDEYAAVGREVQAVCKKYGATFIVNDNSQLALELGADGVHVGKTDPLPEEDVRMLVERDCIIGCTANTIEDIEALQMRQASYIGLGPFRFTSTKQNLSPILGLEGYQKIFAAIEERKLIHPPVIGIGGIEQGDVRALLGTGLHGIAVSGAISNAADVVKAAKKFERSVYGSWLTKNEATFDLPGGMFDLLGDYT